MELAGTLSQQISCCSVFLLIYFVIYRDFFVTIGRLHVTSWISRQKKWMTKSSNLCWKGIGRTPTFGVILKTNEKLIKIWNELLLVGF